MLFATFRESGAIFCGAFSKLQVSQFTVSRVQPVHQSRRPIANARERTKRNIILSRARPWMRAGYCPHGMKHTPARKNRMRDYEIPSQ